MNHDHTTFVQKYFDKEWTGKMKVSAEPTLPILVVSSEVFPIKTADIKKNYLAQPPTLAGNLGISTFTIQHPSELGQEAKAKKGVAKLMLLCLRGDVDVRLATVNNVTFVTPAQGMQVVMENPRSGREVALSDLLRQTFIATRDLDPNDIRSRELSMIHVSKAMASHLLLGNLATNGVKNVHNEANAVDPSAFLPQQNLSLVEEQRSKDQNFRTKVRMDVLDSHKTKTATGITRIGSIT